MEDILQGKIKMEDKGIDQGKEKGTNQREERQTKKVPDIKRVFLGITIPDLIVRKISGLRFKIPELETKRFSQLHITLKFFGNIFAGKVPLLLEKVSSIKMPSFDLSLEGLGTFGEKKPSCLWVGVKENASLQALKESVDRMAGSFVEKQDKKEGSYNPHITLVRLNRAPSSKFLSEIEKQKTTDFGSFRVESFIVFESILKSTGAEHIPLKVVPLLW
jgi:2'-5' RNA ligase